MWTGWTDTLHLRSSVMTDVDRMEGHTAPEVCDDDVDRMDGHTAPEVFCDDLDKMAYQHQVGTDGFSGRYKIGWLYQRTDSPGEVQAAH